MEEGFTGDGESAIHGRPPEAALRDNAESAPSEVAKPPPDAIEKVRESTEPLDLGGSALLRALHALDSTEVDPSAASPGDPELEGLAETIADGNTVDPLANALAADAGSDTSTQWSECDDGDGLSRLAIRGRVAPGSMVGHCEILEQIGRGGMGEVYRARQRTMKVDRLVALKLIRANLSADARAPDSPSALARFHVEMMAAARLQHDHIVPVYEVGEHNGSPYYTMLLVDGPSLAERLRLDPMSGPEAAALLEPIARAVGLAHSQGIVHRDVKPSNIIIDSRGKPYLSDFGLAKPLEQSLTLTKTDALLGSPPYMSPEQARDSSQVGPASDVYSLGATFYEMLTGRPPFQASDPIETMRQVIDEFPVPPQRLNRAVPRDLETICLRCLEKDPGRRYGTADALADELKRFREGEPIVTRPLSSWGHVARWTRRRPATAGLVAAVVLSLLFVLADTTYHLQQARKTLAELEFRAYRDSLVMISGAIDAGRMPDAERRLEECPENLRGWEWRFLNRLCHRKSTVLNSSRGSIYGVAFRPGGGALAAGGRRGTLGVWDVGSDAKALDLPGVPAETTIRAVDWSQTADGRERIAAGCSDGLVRIWTKSDPAGGWEPPRELRGHDGAVDALAFTADGRRLATTGDDGRIQVWEVAGASDQPAWNLKSVGTSILGVSFGPWNDRLVSVGEDQVVRVWRLGPKGTATHLDLGSTRDVSLGVAVSHGGRLIAAAGAEGRVTIWSPDAPGVLKELTAHFEGVNALAFSPDDQRLATAGADRAVKLWDTESWTTVLARTSHDDQVEALAFSADGQRLASAAADGSIVIWDARPWVQAAILPPRTLLGHVGSVSALAVRGDGRQIATAGADAVVRLWDAATGRLTDTLVGHLNKVNALAYSPDDQLLASAGRDGAVRIWRLCRPEDATTKPDVRLLGYHRERCIALAFSPDGRLLATGGADRVVRLWDAVGSRPPVAWSAADEVYCLAFSPDGRLLATAGADDDGAISLWELNPVGDRRERRLLGHQRQINSLAFSPDGRCLASVSHDWTGRIWDLKTGRAVVLRGHLSRLWGVAVSDDGQVVATAGGDWSIRIWDRETGEQQAALLGHQGRVRAVAFDPQGRYVASTGDDGEVRIWDASRWRGRR
ncbi:MAG: protein kinase [Paludisphaera borealis]|uniref:WD40 repeat domain-containing serine/threonine protein kinase n=1 Tax=Paludisphaera borealis TaxID=1387353 RepID=UPI002845D8EB|nr:protein kinase [Paludisphaera borealis]MDR3621788.1 protein kinase [Paludisphaera borealis]